MIKIVNLKNMRRLAKDGTDTCIAIVRSMRNPIAGVTQLDVLSPSRQLFYWYLDQSRAGCWNRDAFENGYLPRFLKEIRTNPAAGRALKSIWSRSRAGENIALGCFCADETTCHRSIIAGLLSGSGADVRTETGRDYSEYWKIYQAIPRA